MSIESNWQSAAKRAPTESIESKRKERLQRIADFYGMPVDDVNSLQRSNYEGRKQGEITGVVNGVRVDLKMKDYEVNYDGSKIDGQELVPEDASLIYHALDLAIEGRNAANNLALDSTIDAIDSETAELTEYKKNVRPLVRRVLPGITLPPLHKAA